VLRIEVVSLATSTWKTRAEPLIIVGGGSMASTPCAEGIEAIMFRTIGDGPSAWESLLPAEVLRLPEDLARVDDLLDDPVFLAVFSRCWGGRRRLGQRRQPHDSLHCALS